MGPWPHVLMGYLVNVAKILRSLDYAEIDLQVVGTAFVNAT